MATAADDRTAEIAREYGQFVAVVPIDVDGVRAFAVGDPVPASTVEANPEWLKPSEDSVQASVARVNTKAAKAATEPV